jgi:hypothetical protein
MSFTIVLNSTLGDVGLATDNSKITYNINWAGTPEWSGKYKVGMSFITRQNTTTANDVGLVTVNWGAVHDCFTATTANGTANNTALGFIRPVLIGTNQQMYADYSTNVPVILQAKPQNNQFAVTVVGNTGALLTTLVGIYFLTIHFEAID